MPKNAGLNRQERSMIRLIGALHEAALDGSRWHEALDAIRRMADSRSGIITWFDLSEAQVLRNVYVENDPDAIEIYCDTFPVNPVVRAFQEMRVPLHGALRDVVPEEHLRRLPFYREVMQSLELEYAAGAVLKVDEREGVALGLGREVHQGAYEAAHKELLARLVPHLQQAVRIHARLARVTVERELALTALERVPFGVVLLDETGAPIYVNDYADGVLRSGGPLQLRGRQWRAVDPEDSRRLQRLIGQALETGRGEGIAPGGMMRLEPPDERAAPLTVTVMPLTDERRVMAPGPSTCLGVAVFITRGADTAPVQPQVLQRLFGLTPAEARLVSGLIAGRSLAEIAAAQHISRHTARDHLKAAFGKTGTHRQAELVQRVLLDVALRIPLGAGADPDA